VAEHPSVTSPAGADGGRRSLRLPELGRKAGGGLPLPRGFLTVAAAFLGVLGIAAAVLLPRVSVPRGISAVGLTEPARSWTVSSPRPGVIRTLLVKAGEPVARGQALFRVDAIHEADAGRPTELVRAPAAGVVGAGDPGQLLRLEGRRVEAGEPVLELLDPSMWQVRFFVAASAVPGIHVGDSVRVSIDALRGRVEQPLDADVVGVATRPSTRGGFEGRFAVLARLRLPPDSALAGALRQGFSARVDLVTGDRKLAALVREWTRGRLSP